MHRSASASRHQQAARRVGLAALALLLLTVLGRPPDARAEHEAPVPRASVVELPDVTHRPEATAVRQLERLGLVVRREHVASAHVGEVVGTVPAAGSLVERNGEVLLRVGVPVRVQTIVPHVPHRRAEIAIASLEDIYAIAIESVRGPARLEGRVIGQLPHAGAHLPFRGLLTLRVVDNQTTVPYVEGLPLRRALRLLRRAGLHADIREVPQPGIDRAVVLRQRARAGRRVPYDTAVRLRVATPLHDDAPPWHEGRTRDRPATPRAAVVTVPDVRGLALRDAVRLMHRLGLRIAGGADDAYADARIRRQAPLPGARARAGSSVRLELAETETPERRRRLWR